MRNRTMPENAIRVSRSAQAAAEAVVGRSLEIAPHVHNEDYPHCCHGERVRTQRIRVSLNAVQREYDSTVPRVPEHADTVRDLARAAGLDPRGISGGRIRGVRPR